MRTEYKSKLPVAAPKLALRINIELSVLTLQRAVIMCCDHSILNNFNFKTLSPYQEYFCFYNESEKQIYIF